MKVLQLLSSAGLYGAERMVISLSRALERIGHTSVLCLFENAHSPNTETARAAAALQVSVVSLPCNGKVDWRALARLAGLLTEGEFDLLHTHGYKADIYGYAAARHTRCPVIATCHNWIENTRSLRLYAVLDRFVLQHVDKAVSVSEHVAAILHGVGAAKCKTEIISNGIDIDEFETAQPLLREEVGSRNRPLIGAVGRLSPEKGMDDFVLAACHVARVDPRPKFVIVGDGPERAMLEQRVRDLDLTGKLFILGRRDDMPNVYASLDVLVLPSRDEGLPMTILEGLAARKAIIATAVGAVPTVVVHQQTGLLVPANAPASIAAQIIRLVGDPELRTLLGSQGHDLVQQRFSSDVMAQSYAELYQSIASTHGYGTRYEKR